MPSAANSESLQLELAKAGLRLGGLYVG